VDNLPPYFFLKIDLQTPTVGDPKWSLELKLKLLDGWSARMAQALTFLSTATIDSDEGESSFSPLVRLPAIRMSHALDIWCYTRAYFAGSLDGFRLRLLHSAGSLRTGSANGKIALRPSFHVHIFSVHRWSPLSKSNIDG
jgi:hypothetical protein